MKYVLDSCVAIKWVLPEGETPRAVQTVEWRDGYLIAPWHGREDAERGEAFAARLRAETGCLVADRRNGRVVDVSRVAPGRAARPA